MGSTTRDQDYGTLLQELQSDEYRALLRKLRVTASSFEEFGTWADVLAFMHAGTSTDPRKDEVLYPILRAHGQDMDPRWRTILLAMFWPGLRSMAYRRRGYEDDLEYGADELWQNAVWVFLKVVRRLDVRRRHTRLPQKIMNDTYHDLYQVYLPHWRHQRYERLYKEDDIDRLSGGVDGIRFEVICRREELEQRLERLREHRDAGRITDADFLLLVATRVNGVSLAEYARDVGLGYEAAKKRRQRAEASIRRFEAAVP